MRERRGKDRLGKDRKGEKQRMMGSISDVKKRTVGRTEKIA